MTWAPHNKASASVHESRASEARERRACLKDASSHALSALDRATRSAALSPSIGAEYDVRIEHSDERLEVTSARGGEERCNNIALNGKIDLFVQWGTADALACAAR